MVENAVLGETGAGVAVGLDWGVELLGFTEEAELASENLVTCDVSGLLECVLPLQFGNEVDRSCISNLVVIASLEGVKAEITELGDGVLCSVEVTGEAKVGPSGYPEESAGWLLFRVEKVAVGWTS